MSSKPDNSLSRRLENLERDLRLINDAADNQAEMNELLKELTTGLDSAPSRRRRKAAKRADDPEFQRLLDEYDTYKTRASSDNPPQTTDIHLL